MKRVIVTGGAGLIGSHLCRRLLKEGYDVVCVDNFYTGSKHNIADLLKNPYFELITHDVEESLMINASMIYNLACPASPVHYQKDPVKTVRTSVFGAINMLELAKKSNAKILQASTSEVYGDPTVHPQNEEYWGNVNPVGLRSCYDEGKRCAETLFFDYWRQFGVKIKVARIFNTYGPAMSVDDGRVISNFILQALRNEDITIYGDGTHTRCFCYVADMVDALVNFMNLDDEVTGPVNIGHTEEISMKQLAEIIIEMSGSKSSVKYFPLPENDPQRRKPDTSLIEKLINWKPVTPLEEGLNATIKYFKELQS
ncbi:MAG TPA: SDR family oxidoreductase [bacterium]|nr:SDR family oxidoreductase [bacterium]HNW16071.1 SDR family oxidoreductase [bacterium]HPG34915.1 SDR family oxidoreductase [bacterium]HPM45662.1 SDR family oxidoreductase [bacterium]HRQ70372.1 SDR family oxidoreductase [bacterium]